MPTTLAQPASEGNGGDDISTCVFLTWGVSLPGMKDRQEQVRVATVVMNGLAQGIGQTLGFGVLNRASEVPAVEVIASVEGVSGFCFHTDPGFQIPLHTSAPGKAILGYLTANERDTLIDRISFDVYTENTIRSPKAFTAALREVQAQGYATDCNEQI